MSILAFGLFAYVVGMGGILLIWNWLLGGLIEGWHEEYVGADGEIQGSGKWRTIDGRVFQDVGLLLGMWVYPFGIAAAVLLIRQALQRRGRRAILISALAVLLILGIVAKLEYIGFSRAITSF